MVDSKRSETGKIRVFYIAEVGEKNKSLDFLVDILKFPENIKSKLVIDEDNPEYLFVFPFIYSQRNFFQEFIKYYGINNDSANKRVFVFFGGEAIEPDLNIFDYVITCNSLMQYDGRICRIPPSLMYGKMIDNANHITYEEALNKVKNNNLKFCNFIYSNSQAHPFRDQLFYEISKYKRVDSLGSHLKNVNLRATREKPDWKKISIDIKSEYKFTIASENALFNGYTSEKLLTSFQAHSVPIYFGNPQVAEEYNPEAFINCHDYKNFDDLIARIKEIDDNDELWAKIVNAPWQTESQIQDFNNKVLNYYNFLEELFMPYEKIEDKIRRPIGTWADRYRSWFFKRKYTGNTLMMKIKRPFHNLLKVLGYRD